MKNPAISCCQIASLFYFLQPFPVLTEAVTVNNEYGFHYTVYYVCVQYSGKQIWLDKKREVFFGGT